jgi:transcriptional regulator with XRE-family HTH domain/DNA-directed RNA polymerase subunit RPC12/RpoP
MDQIRIGKFIAAKRKEKGLTQAQLAEKLGITDRAVSKWETGKSLPDASIMLELCGLLGITVNDLLSGEVVTMERINERMQKNLLDMVREKEAADRRLLKLEVLVGVLAAVFLATLVLLAALLTMPDWLRCVLMGFGLAVFLAGALVAVRLEQVAGYYECRACGHRYVPTYARVNLAAHIGRTRYMKCPKCGKRSWQKKVLTREQDLEG